MNKVIENDYSQPYKMGYYTGRQQIMGFVIGRTLTRQTASRGETFLWQVKAARPDARR